jgi:hypothetical protein
MELMSESQAAIRQQGMINGSSGVSFGLEDFAPTIETCGTDMMTQMNFARHRLDASTGREQGIMRTMHAALGGGFFVLLNGHESLR